MTRTRYKIYDDAYPYFITSTINGWLPIFTRQEAADIIIDAWKFAQSNRGLDLFAYVILENHLHMIVAANELSDVIQRFKSYTAHEIVKLLQDQPAVTLLRQLRAIKLNHKTESEYQVWQEGGKPKQITSEEIMRQKIEYIHYNPVKRGFVDRPEDWRWSSARNYAGIAGLMDVVTDW